MKCHVILILHRLVSTLVSAHTGVCDGTLDLYELCKLALFHFFVGTGLFIVCLCGVTTDDVMPLFLLSCCIASCFMLHVLISRHMLQIVPVI